MVVGEWVPWAVATWEFPLRPGRAESPHSEWSPRFQLRPDPRESLLGVQDHTQEDNLAMESRCGRHHPV